MIKTIAVTASMLVLVAICWTLIRDDLEQLTGLEIDHVDGIEFVAALFLIVATLHVLRSVFERKDR